MTLSPSERFSSRAVAAILEPSTDSETMFASSLAGSTSESSSPRARASMTEETVRSPLKMLIASEPVRNASLPNIVRTVFLMRVDSLSRKASLSPNSLNGWALGCGKSSTAQRKTRALGWNTVHGFWWQRHSIAMGGRNGRNENCPPL